jgi:hypothetical protein
MRALKFLGLVLLGTAVAMVPRSAFASAELSFQVNAGPVQTFACPATGGCVNTFTAAGVTFSVDVSANNQPTISLSSSNQTTRSPLTITADYSVNDLIAPGPNYFQSFAGTLNASDSASFTQYYDAGNTLDALTTPIFTVGPFTSTSPFESFGLNHNGAFAFGTGPYSLTMLYTISLNHSASTLHPDFSSVNGSFTVPEPATLSLLGIGLIGLGNIVRRKLRA